MQKGLNTERRGEKNGRRSWGDENRKGLKGEGKGRKRWRSRRKKRKQERRG